MFCVIQEVQLKRPQPHGYSKELISKYFEMSFQGEDMGHWSYHYGYDYFDRPIKKAYKVSIHSNHRENGKVKKKQFSLCTINYYDLATGLFSLYDFCCTKVGLIAKELDVDEEEIYEQVESKLGPLEERIINEFMQTEEYKTHSNHERIINLHILAKIDFEYKYACDKDKYNQIYDVYGNLHNEKKLKEVQRDFQAKKDYEDRCSGYHKKHYSNYGDFFGKSGSSYYNDVSSNYTMEDKDTLKQFYRVLSKKFHPDANPDKDTSNEMKLLNQLKKQWEI